MLKGLHMEYDLVFRVIQKDGGGVEIWSLQRNADERYVALGVVFSELSELIRDPRNSAKNILDGILENIVSGMECVEDGETLESFGTPNEAIKSFKDDLSKLHDSDVSN